VTNQLPGKWLFGRFSAELDGYYGTANLPLTSMAYFWVLPYKLIAGVVGAIVLVVVVMLVTRKKEEEIKEVKE
jgi:uncharacterized membrane protein YeaQ/YmgE (transglycosylase-associated protein family)